MLQLRKLYSEPELFEAIDFLPGINLILGEPSEDSAKTNGVGKSVSIEFLNFALLSRYADSRIKKIPESVFPLSASVCLDLKIGSEEIKIKRSRGKESQPVILRGEEELAFSKLEDAHKFISSLLLGGSDSAPSFRSMMGIFIRDERSEFKSIINGFDTAIRAADNYAPHLYLLGMNIEIYKTIKDLQKEIADLKKKSSEYEKSVMLLRQKKISDARADLNELDSEVALISRDIENLENASTYETLEEDIQEVDLAIKEKRQESAFTLDSISRLEPIEAEKVDISTDELAEYYNDLKSGLGDLVSRDFNELKSFKEKISKFQEQILRNRRSELEEKLKSTRKELRELDKRYKTLISVLDQSGALSTLKQTFASYQEKSDQLADLRSFINGYDEARSLNKEKSLQKDLEVQKLEIEIKHTAKTIKSFETTILDIHEFAMGNRLASFHIDTYPKRKQVVEFVLRIDSDGSHSVERLKTFIYDFSLLVNEETSKRHFQVLVHDNIFEVDTDTLRKSLRFIESQAASMDGQYILTLNSDRASSDAPEVLENLEKCVRARFTKSRRFLRRAYKEE